MNTNILAPILLCIVHPIIAAVPIHWTVETSRAQPAIIEAYHGETLSLEATLQSYGKPLASDPQEAWNIYWQTNGMGAAWWSEPCASPANNILRATFTPNMDPGASSVNGFIGSPGSSYRAAFTIRFRHSPGASPNAIAKPVPVLDLANTTVINAPWPTDETITATVRRVIAEDGLNSGVDEGAVRDIIDSTVTQPYVKGLGFATDDDLAAKRDYDDLSLNGWYTTGMPEGMDIYWGPIWSGDAWQLITEDADWVGSEGRDTDIIHWNMAAGYATYTPVSRRNRIVSEATIAPTLDKVDESIHYSSAIYRYMTASTNAWFAGTNYVVTADASTRQRFAFEDGMDLATVPCSMALWEIRDGVKVCVWDQRDWISWYFAFKRRQLLDEINPRIDDKADKAWSHHTATGIDNPAEDTVWLDTPKVVISAGYAWQKNVTTSGNGFFTLVSNGLWSFGNSAKGSFFEIKDFEGNSLFKVSKTDSYLADVAPQNVVPDGDDLLLRCLFSPPDAIDKTDLTVYGCNDLVTESWTDLSTADAPGTVSFTGAINDWTLRITPKNPQGKFFAFVKVRVEGQTKNEFAAPIEFQKIVINNITYTVGTATINGNTVLTLTR